MPVYNIQKARVLTRLYRIDARFACCKINSIIYYVYRYTKGSGFFNTIHWTSQFVRYFFISVIFYVFLTLQPILFYFKPWKTTKTDLGCGVHVCVKTHKHIYYTYLYHIYDTHTHTHINIRWGTLRGWQ